MGSLIRVNDDDFSIKVMLFWIITLIPMTETLTGARSLIAKAEIEVEIRRQSWAV